MRFEIAGGIASGKTTLAKLLGLELENLSLEDFRSNPFWAKFYRDPKRYAFETEVTFHLQHYSQFLDAECSGRRTVCDTSLLLDLAYADVNLTGSKYETFLRVYQEVQASLQPPLAIVFLQCSPEEELRRVIERARSEEASVPLEYLSALNQALKRRVDEVRDRIKVIELDSEQLDFANIDSEKKKAKEVVLQAI